MVDKMDTHDHEKDSLEPLKQEYFEGKHLAEPVKEIQVKNNNYIEMTEKVDIFLRLG
jgi:hypothetical protein